MATLQTTNYVSSLAMEGQNVNSSNTAINGLLQNTNFITSADGTTVLNVQSQQVQVITGTLAQNIQFPDSTTLFDGYTIIINNQSTQNVTANYNDATLLSNVAPGISTFILTGNGTSNGVWNVSSIPQLTQTGNTSWTPADASTAGLVFTGVTANYSQSGKNITGSLTLTYPTTTDTNSAIISGIPTAYAVNFGVGFASNNTEIIAKINAETNQLELFAVGGGALTNILLSGLTIDIGFSYSGV